MTKAGMPKGCMLIDSFIRPCNKRISDLPSPQPGQCSKPAKLSGQNVKWD